MISKREKESIEGGIAIERESIKGWKELHNLKSREQRPILAL